MRSTGLASFAWVLSHHKTGGARTNEKSMQIVLVPDFMKLVNVQGASEKMKPLG
jgi:hypothetical protein